MIAPLLACVAFAVAAPLHPAVSEDRVPLRFRADGSFKVVAFTDTQVGTFLTDRCQSITPDMEPCDAYNTTDLMRTIIDAEQPDLVVLTGDIVTGGATVETYLTLMEPMIERNVPWAASFGNHDDDSPALTREILGEVEVGLRPLSQLDPSPEGVQGVSNYVLSVAGSDSDAPAFSLFFFDSGDSDESGLGIGGYDWIRPNQIAWYVQESNRIRSEAGKVVPAAAFNHIPLREYITAIDGDFDCYGEQYESVFPPNVNSGLFAAFLEQGDVVANVAGHDHVNSIACKYAGVKLIYNRATGYTTYGREGFRRGARVFVFHEDSPEFETYERLDDASIVTPPDGW